MKGKHIFILIINIIVAFFIFWMNLKSNNGNNNCQIDFVEKVYDGDTIVGKNLGKIRILGIDTPEIFHKGWTQVKNYKFYACGSYSKDLANKYLYHKNVKVCFDKNDNRTGGYGRNLGYIFFTGDENKSLDFGKLLVKMGYAKVYRNASFIYKKEYIQLERLAKNKKVGIWTQKCFLKDKQFKELHKNDK